MKTCQKIIDTTPKRDRATDPLIEPRFGVPQDEGEVEPDDEQGADEPPLLCQR